MPEERTLVANFIPKIDEEALAQIANQMSEGVSSELRINVDAQSSESSSTGNANQTLEDVKSTLDDINDTLDDVNDSVGESAKGGAGGADGKGGFLSKLTDTLGDMKGGLGKIGGMIGDIPNIMAKGPVGIIMAGVNMLVELVMGLWKRLVASSPLLKNILDMFKGVLDLILGPIGTAIGIEMIPLLTDLYEKVMGIVQKMWKAYDEKGLQGMISEAIQGVIDILITFVPQFVDLLVQVMPQIVKGVIDGLLSVIGLGGGGGSILGNILGNIPGLGGLGRLIGGFFADGGVVEPTPGGQLIVAGEGGEREFIIPQSKLEQYTSSVASNSAVSRGGDTYYITVQGYTDTDLTDKIVSAIDKRSNFRHTYGGLRCHSTNYGQSSNAVPILEGCSMTSAQSRTYPVHIQSAVIRSL